MSKEYKYRIPVYVSNNVKEYLHKESEKYGMSISAFMNMLIANHRHKND